MEVLFKDDVWIYYIENGILIAGYVDIYLKDITHLNAAKILYYYIDENDGERFPVYYETNKRFITKYMGSFVILDILRRYTKDHTLTNLNLL